ncbi:MAG: ATP-binding cassette domain-containing protein, partial [Bacteroidota bacterium]
VEDPRNPAHSKIPTGDIALKDISFTYDNSVTVFKNFSLTIPTSQTIGIVGESGSGKSTLTNLLLRFDDVQKGQVCIGGVDVRDITQANLRKAISYVPQEPQLLHRSIKDNIAFAKPKATKAQIIAAAKGAKAHEFIMQLPDGYETLVGERGIKLSGGQRQRIAIARVMLENPKVIVLDEATSALDTESEQAVQTCFNNVMKGRTAVVIAHRLSTIAHLDRIIVLDKGKIVEDGTHRSLLRKGGKYAKLWKGQGRF